MVLQLGLLQSACLLAQCWVWLTLLGAGPLALMQVAGWVALVARCLSLVLLAQPAQGVC